MSQLSPIREEANRLTPKMRARLLAAFDEWRKRLDPVRLSGLISSCQAKKAYGKPYVGDVDALLREVLSREFCVSTMAPAQDGIRACVKRGGQMAMRQIKEDIG
jgi:hypothetical protein